MTDLLFDTSPAGYFSFYDNGTIYIVNQTLCDALGYEKSELTGKTVENIFTLPTRIFYQTHFFPMVKMHGHAEEIFITLLTKKGEFLPVLLNAKRSDTRDGAFTACSFIIVPNRKKFEDELVTARKEAERALFENTELQKARLQLQEHAEQLDTQMHILNERNNELKQLNHVITHSLKEPLRKMLLFVDRLQFFSLPEELEATMEKLNRASNQMKNIVKGLQQYIWLDDVDLIFKRTDLNLLIEDARAQLKNETGEDLLELKISDLPEIDGDAIQLTLLFYHILSNAVKFKKETKAYVTVKATVIQKNRFRSVKEKYSYEDFLKIEFTDEGIGFDPNAGQAVFELFRKLHMMEGAGLGLALCKKIAGNHSGYITISSLINKGTTVQLLLPLVQKISPDHELANKI